MAKSFTSALIGIAMNDGLIPSVDVPMTDYIPEWVGTPREDITLRHVLTMSSGLDWIEDYNAMALNSSDIIAMVLNAPDELEYAASQPLLNAPGSTFNYSSGDTMLLSAVIEQATGMTAGEYAAQKLFAPIALDPAEWWRDAANHTLTYCCLDTNSRNFARFGLLYLRNGLWGSTQVVPEAWVAESLAPSPANEGYGYKWWLIGRTNPALPPDTFAARGHDTQRIYVIPSLDLVVVRNGLYVKYVGEPIADPNLFGKYPSSGLVPNQGTSPPDSWIDAEFLTPIVESITP
jgi:CubicO group peptidase (beta-lactamase class C family)